MADILKQANDIIENFAEDLEITELIQERKKKENRIRYTLDDIKIEFDLE